MWSLGCIIFNMCTGVPPFYLTNNLDNNKIHYLYASIRRAAWQEEFEPFVKICSKDLYDILTKTLNPNPNIRYTAAECV